MMRNDKGTALYIGMGLLVIFGWFGIGLLPDYKDRNKNYRELLHEIRSIGPVFALVHDDDCSFFEKTAPQIGCVFRVGDDVSLDALGLVAQQGGWVSAGTLVVDGESRAFYWKGRDELSLAIAHGSERRLRVSISRGVHYFR